jgi:hypothetical protein
MEVADVAHARASYKVFRDAMNSGREIMWKDGVADTFRLWQPILRKAFRA